MAAFLSSLWCLSNVADLFQTGGCELNYQYSPPQTLAAKYHHRSSGLIASVRCCVIILLLASLCSFAYDAQAQCTGNGVTTPITAADESSTSPNSKQLVNGASTTVVTSNPGQISVEVGSSSGVLAKTATYTIMSTDPPFVTINPGSTAATLTLPAANSVPGRMITVEYIGGTANVTLQTNQTNQDTLDGATYTTTQTLNVAGQSITLESDGGNPGNWRVIKPLSLAGTGIGFTYAAGGITVTSTGSGSVTSFSANNLSPLFATSVANPTTTPVLSFILDNVNANLVFAGPSSGSATTPTFRSLVGADLPDPTASTLGGIESFAAISHKWINIISTSGVPSATQPASTDLSDLPIPVSSGGLGISTTPSNGEIPIGNGSGYTAATLTAGSGVTITNGSGSITIAASGGGGGSGFGGNGADGAKSNPSSYTAPNQVNATTWSLTGANTCTITGTPTIINCTSTFTLGDGTNASTLTSTAGNGAAGGLAGISTFGTQSGGGSGAGPGGGTSPIGNTGTATAGGGGGGYGAAGGNGGGTASSITAPNGGRTYQCWINGGSGGAGGGYDSTSSASPGAGGAGGGAIVVCAVGAIDCKTSSVINNKGANGTAGSSTTGCGGGGGSGGLVFLASQASVTVAGTITVSGGNGGNGSSSTGGGGGGGGGGRIVLWSPSNTTSGSTLTLSGGSGGSKATTGTAGASGSTATSQSITGTPNLPLFAYILKSPEGGKFLDALTDIEIALGHCHNNLVEIDQKTLAWKAGHGTLQGFCLYQFGNMTGTTCFGVGDAVKVEGRV